MLTSERIAEIQSRSRADYACLDAPGFRDSLAARRDVAALLSDRTELVAEIERLRGLLSEWTDMDPLRYDTEYSCCPWCNFDYSSMKHEPDCAFVQARSACGISAALEASDE